MKKKKTKFFFFISIYTKNTQCTMAFIKTSKKIRSISKIKKIKNTKRTKNIIELSIGNPYKLFKSLQHLNIKK